MVSLKRSFLYTLIIFCCLALLVLAALSMLEEKEPKRRTKINPARFISKTEQPIDKKYAAKQAEENIPPQPDKSEPTKAQKTTKKLSSSKKESKALSTLPTLEKNSRLKLPQASKDLIEALDALPEASESKLQQSPQEAMLNELYGDEITKLSTTAKKYLLDNHLKMQIITQRVLNRIGRVYIDPRFHYYAYNYVEFTLYPDGHISHIRLLKDAGFNLLDQITKETIETAFKDYPLPSEPVLVRYKFLYDLRAY